MATPLSQREMEILSAAFQSIKGPVKIDYERLALLAGYKTAASASVSFGLVKRKLGLTGSLGTEGKAGPATPKCKEKAGDGEESGDDKAGADEEAKTPIIPKKRGRKPKGEIDADVAGTTPARKKRATKGKVMNPGELGIETVNDAGIIDDGNGAVVKPTPKKRGRKPKLLSLPSKLSSDTTPGEYFYSENDDTTDVNVATNFSEFNHDDNDVNVATNFSEFIHDDNDVNVATNFSEFIHDDSPPIIKQEDEDKAGYDSPAFANDLEAIRAMEEQWIADEALKKLANDDLDLNHGI